MEGEFTLEDVISLMKRTKKTDALFKPLKKLKTAIEGIGAASLSFLPTSKVLVFHFGLGNEIDKEFIYLTKPQELTSKVTIIPGHSYSVLHFVNPQAAQQYLESKTIIGGKPVSYTELQYQNLSRTLIFLYCKEDFRKEMETGAIQDCPSKYQPGCIPGLHLFEDIMGRQEEAALLLQIDAGEWEKLNNRRVQHFGYKFKYGRNQIDKDEQQGSLPAFLHPLLNKLSNLPPLQGMHFDQLTINDYFAGNGIPAHFDTHSPFEEVFVSVSLLSGLVMEFKRFDGEEKSVYLRERSVAVFSGEARFAWTHGISCRKVDMIDGQIQHRSRRLSLTFRKIKFTPCHCPYFFYCDSQGYDQQTMKKNNPLLTKYLSEQHSKQLSALTPSQIEREYVEKAYNGFGFDFHNKVIPQIKAFMQSDFEEGQIVLDLGCGNGEYQKYIKQPSFYIGVEKCRSMVPVQNSIHMDCLKLCFRDGVFDRILLVAVIHHFASQQTRRQALRESCRVLKVGGYLYLTVFSYENKKEIYSTPETLLEYCLPANKVSQKTESVKVQVGRMESRGEVFKRYYHLFTVQQVCDLVRSVNLHIETVLAAGENIIIKATKQPPV